MSGLTVFFVLAVIFMVIVLPLWIVMNFVARNRGSKSVDEEDQAVVSDLLTVINKLEGRIHNLERILDREDPKWDAQSNGE
jgi:phage shock protein B